MKNKNLVLTSFIHGLITVAYVSLVAWLVFNGEKWFGKADTFWMPFAMLLLFVLSAAIIGYLVVGKPIQLYIDNQKKEAAKFLFYTIGWIFLATVITLIIQVVI